jgi:PhnB protein
VTAYLCAKDAAQAIEFYKKAFSATERMRIAQPDGRVGHAEIQIGDSVIMLSDEFPEMGVNSPQSLGGSPVIIHPYVEDADAMFKQAVAAGAKVKRTLADQFYGDRLGGESRIHLAIPGGFPLTRKTCRRNEIEKRAAAASR